ncbi:MAG: SusC/RagA family TonB-linked outer membrane protein, partial [Prevotellaceae bacterium]|nr:SusC/RagA family TonB-linked outer membrane protein [Prevotellaceae bacterium]
MNSKKKTRIFGWMLFFLLPGISLTAQNRAISGTVSESNGDKIPGATIKVQGTNTATMTDLNGQYKLNAGADAKRLEVSYLGMKTAVVEISGSIVNVVMTPEATALDEVVVTGYGTTKKRDLVTSVGSVSAEQLKNVPVTSAAEALQGKLAGVNVTTTEGSPDADVKIRVRGGSSLTQSSEPLYIVDGFPVHNINDIPPSSIQSVDVLKDAAATAIYGAQGANGVIIITTKDAGLSGGNDGKFNFNVDYTGYWGSKKMAKRYEMMNPRDFALMQYEYAWLKDRAQNTTPGLGKKDILSNYNAYFDPVYNENGQNKDIFSPVGDILDYWTAQPHTDWQNETFGRTGINLNNSLTINGGNKTTNFTLSYNRVDDKGIMYESNYLRNNLSLKVSSKPVKDLTVSITGRYSNTEVLGAGANTAEDAGSKTESRVRNAIAYTPIQLFQKDSDSLEDEESYGGMYDPITAIDDNYKFKTDDKWTIQGYVRYKLFKVLTLKSDWGYESRNVNTDRFYGVTTYFSRSGKDNPLLGKGYSAGIVNGAEETKFRNSNTLEYKPVFDRIHSLNVLLGEEIIMNDSETSTEYTFGYDGGYSGREVFAGKAPYIQRLQSNYIYPNDNMLSLFTRVDYNAFSRYYLSLTMRGDASTRFAKENQWGFFPASAVAWRISDEPWMRNLADAARISDLKWRFSYGIAGNNNVDLGYLNNQYVEKLKINPLLGAYIGLAPYNDEFEANATLKWETTITRNLGLDYTFFNGRLSGTVDIYKNSTKDLIIAKKLASGKYQYQNVGETENRGLEFSVATVILDKGTGDVTYGLSANANISFNRGKIISLGGLDEYNVATGYLGSGYLNADVEYKLKVGEELGRVWGYQYDGW